MLFSGSADKAFDTFASLLEDNMKLFADAVTEMKEKTGNRRLSDEEFAACYIDGMGRLIRRLDDWAFRDLSAEPENGKALDRYMQAIEDPSVCGFRFENRNLTIGKIYICYVWARTKKKPSRSMCVKLERLAVQLIGKTCEDCGIVS